MPTTHDLGDDEVPSSGVYAAVAAADGRSPLDLPPLARTIDPDALDALLTPQAGAHEVTFEYAGYLVTATPETIRVEPVDEG